MHKRQEGAPKASNTPSTSRLSSRQEPNRGNLGSLRQDSGSRRIELTDEQKKRVEENRRRALEIQKKRQENNRDARTSESRERSEAATSIPSEENKRPKTSERPSVKKNEYIEYDFSTMKDTHGGFIDTENEQSPGSGKMEPEAKLQVVKELPPPLDISRAPKCFECGSLEIDRNLYDNFNHVRVCRACKRKMPDKYSLLTKTECREDYLLTDPELRDKTLLPRIEKENPHGFSRMQLFLRFQVEEFAWKKWGSSEDLDKEWERREQLRLQRRDKKYLEKLREMRKKTRAEEFTRKLRNGENLGERHVHDWSAPLSIPNKPGFIKRRCIDCGIETEEFQL